MPDTPNPADLIQAILDELVAEINDPRTLPQERNGIRIAHVIVRRVAERRREDQLQADLAAANAEIERLRGALASAREAALREAIEAVREGYDPEFTTNAETAIRALLTTPSGDAKADPVVAAEVHE